jgi:hypothetical protein
MATYSCFESYSPRRTLAYSTSTPVTVEPHAATNFSKRNVAMSWAALVSRQPGNAIAVTEPAAASSPACTSNSAPPRIAVLDANALIGGGAELQSLAERFVTISEVLAEIRDQASRQALASLPFKLEVLSPSEEALAAGEEGVFVGTKAAPCLGHSAADTDSWGMYNQLASLGLFQVETYTLSHNVTELPLGLRRSC